MAAAQGSEPSRLAGAGSARYLNFVLTAIALALGIMALKQTVGLPGEAEAAGQRSTVRAAAASPEEPAMGLPNAAEQRVRMIDSLRSIDGRLRAIETKLTSGPIDVRVVELPEAPEHKE